MNNKYCYKCGCKLRKTTLGRSFCPNCGITDNGEYKEEVNDNPSYLT